MPFLKPAKFYKPLEELLWFFFYAILIKTVRDYHLYT